MGLGTGFNEQVVFGRTVGVAGDTRPQFDEPAQGAGAATPQSYLTCEGLLRSIRDMEDYGWAQMARTACGCI